MDTSKIVFNSRSVKWDGSEKRIEIEGELPDGVSVRYENNGKTEVGEYEITAIFDCGKNYESIPNMTATLTVLALTYEITFVEEDGTIRKVVVESGNNVEMPAPKEKRGYIGKWSVEDIGSVHEDIVVYPVYEPVIYKIEYEMNGGVLDENYIEEYTVEDTVRLDIPNREYYDFVGWYGDIACDGDEIEEIPLNSIGDIKLYAKWIEKEYTVGYELNGGQNNLHNENRDDVYVYTVSSEDLELGDPIRKGYRFVRWKDKDGEDVTVIRADKPSSFTVYAEWEIIRYGIKYELNGGENAETNPEEYTVEDKEIVLAEPSRYGYRFLGWYGNEDLSEGKIAKIYGQDCKDITVYAKWENAMYTVESVGGKNILTEYDYGYGDELVISADIDGTRIEGIASGVLARARRVELEGFERVNDDAFAGCELLEELVLPSTLTKMQNGLLKDCVNLRSLTVPYVTDRRIEAGYGEYYPLCELFGRSAKEGSYAVEVRTANANSLTDSLTGVYKGYSCYVPNSLEEITVLGGDIVTYSLYGLVSVKRIIIQGECKSIETKAMAGCTALESVVLPKGLETVKKNIFDDCINLREIYIHESTDKAILEELRGRLRDEMGIEPDVIEYGDIDDISDSI